MVYICRDYLVYMVINALLQEQNEDKDDESVVDLLYRGGDNIVNAQGGGNIDMLGRENEDALGGEHEDDTE